MWVIENDTPFAAERCWVRDRDGAEVWLIAVRGTFVIGSDGSTTLANEHGEVCLVPKFEGEPSSSSLVYDTDLVHTKIASDVLLHGHAFAPQGRPATRVDVTLKIGNIDKTLRVSGDRHWQDGVLGLSMTSPEPFETMPIVYERAFGGSDRKSDDPKRHAWDERNPVGVGFAIEAEHLIGQPVPNIEYPEEPISSWRQRPRPAGFGPIPGHWLPRPGFAGTYDAAWERERLPLLPDDFDDRYYNCAPLDQQIPGFLRGGELVELQNLTPDGILRFNLPRVTFRFRTYFRNGELRYHRARLHTVILEPDFPRVIMVWHTQLPCHHEVLQLNYTTISVLPRVKVSERERALGIWMDLAER
jgi:hypothetical protein